MFKDKMVTTAIPERVYALCKIVERSPLSTAELKEKMEPIFLDNGTEYFNDYKKAAEELGLISISDDLVTLAVDPKIIKNIESMRCFINTNLEQFNTSQFYLVTNAYFEKGSEILKEGNNIASLAPMFTDLTGIPVDAVAMRAWRFWASFLGFGYLHEKTIQIMLLIPNAYVFLWDIICSSKVEKNKLYSVSDFIELITPMSNIIISNKESKMLNYGVSNGLRALHASKKIKLEHIHDQEDMWTLYPLKSYSNDSTITHITIM